MRDICQSHLLVPFDKLCSHLVAPVNGNGEAEDKQNEAAEEDEAELVEVTENHLRQCILAAAAAAVVFVVFAVVLLLSMMMMMLVLLLLVLLLLLLLLLVCFVET